MKARQYTEEQIIAVLREGEASAKVADLCRKYGMSDATYYNRKAKYAGLTVSELKRLKSLEDEKIPATLFISGRWIDANSEIFKELSKNPLFEIENHGSNHKPCSSIGRSIYGIEGTKNSGEVYDEIEQNAIKIQTLTGHKPRYYRPGTAYCDEFCVEVANALGYEVVNFSVLGDAGITYSKEQVKEALLNTSPSSIVILHMNHPKGETAKGLMEAVPELKKQGFKFVKLSEYDMK